MDDYKHFGPEEYIQEYFQRPGEAQNTYADFLLKNLARFYTSKVFDAAQNSLKILDYGCGPSIGLSISAAPKASELILAEYAEQNRKYLKKWLDN